MKPLFLLLLLHVSTFNAVAQWVNLGLDEYQVNDLTLNADTIYASTDDGIFKKSIFSTDTQWTSSGMQGKYVVQTLVENYHTFYALVQIESTNTTRLFKSEDAGLSFSLMTTDTSNIDDYQYLDHMAHPVNNYDTLYLLNHQLKTNDAGATWESMNYFVATNRFIRVNPTNPAQIIIGGEGDFFNATLQISNDFGQSWAFAAMQSYFAGDNCVHDLAIDGEKWYAAGEGVINLSTSEGENWVPLLDLFDNGSAYSLYFTSIEFSPVSTDILYVSGLKGGNADHLVPLLYTDNQGATWDTLSHIGPSANQQIRCLTVENIENNDHVFLGGKGVFLYKRLVTQVADHTHELNLTIYPNPTADKLFIVYASVTNDRLTANIFDLQGHLMAKQNFEPGNGEQTFAIDTSVLSRGTYVLQLIEGINSGSREFVVD